MISFIMVFTFLSQAFAQLNSAKIESMKKACMENYEKVHDEVLAEVRLMSTCELESQEKDNNYEYVSYNCIGLGQVEENTQIMLSWSFLDEGSLADGCGLSVIWSLPSNFDWTPTNFEENWVGYKDSSSEEGPYVKWSHGNSIMLTLINSSQETIPYEKKALNECDQVYSDALDSILKKAQLTYTCLLDGPDPDDEIAMELSKLNLVGEDYRSYTCSNANSDFSLNFTQLNSAVCSIEIQWRPYSAFKWSPEQHSNSKWIDVADYFSDSQGIVLQDGFLLFSTDEQNLESMKKQLAQTKEKMQKMQEMLQNEMLKDENTFKIIIREE